MSAYVEDDLEDPVQICLRLLITIYREMEHRMKNEAPDDLVEDLEPTFMEERRVKEGKWRIEVITKTESSPDASKTTLRLTNSAKSTLIDLTEIPTGSVSQATTRCSGPELCHRDFSLKTSEDEDSICNNDPYLSKPTVNYLFLNSDIWHYRTLEWTRDSSSLAKVVSSSTYRCCPLWKQQPLPRQNSVPNLQIRSQAFPALQSLHLQTLEHRELPWQIRRSRRWARSWISKSIIIWYQIWSVYACTARWAWPAGGRKHTQRVISYISRFYPSWF